MAYEKERLEAIRSNVEEQIQIINEVRSTKAYKSIEGFHYVKNQKGIGKVQNIAKALNHVCGQPDVEITSQDPMEALLRLQTELKYTLNVLEIVLEKYGSCISLFQKIWEAKNSGHGVICIFAPLEEIDMPDGYSRRVKNIDSQLDKGILRVYVAKAIGIEGVWPHYSIQADNYISIRYDAFNEEQCLFIAMVAHLIGVCYVHSVYQALLPIIQNTSITKLYDFHGVVPEELKLMGNEEDAQFYSRLEEQLVKNVDYIITANFAMKRHILNKYPECGAEFIVMPMNNDDNNQNENIQGNEEQFITKKKEDRKPVVIYSGGLQGWQLISEMQDAICKQRDNCEFHLYVSDPKEFMRLWGERAYPEQWEVTTKTAEELRGAYEQAQYGFVLRDNIIVNNVACPTKLIDYIKYDIIPILKSPHIGDFDRYGLQYLSIEDFLVNKFPTDEEEKKMCKKNKEIISSILEDYQHGRDQVIEIINASCNIRK